MIALSRKKKFILNTCVSLLLQIATIICGLIVPRMIIEAYGSEINGLVSSIAQYLGFISLAECGIGAVTQSALYKPLAENDIVQVSKIVVSSKRFYRKLGYILLGYIGVLLVVFPFAINKTFDWWFTASLILAIAISTFAQYYFSMTYRLLLSASQLGFVQMSFSLLTLILNTICSWLFIKLGFSIQIVKLASSIIFLLQPIFLALSIRKIFKLDKKVKITEEPIKQKWNGLAQHVSSVIADNTDIIVLSFYSLISVSIYNVYYMVVAGLRRLIESLSSGFQSLIGDMYARSDMERLKNVFSQYEWVTHMVIVFLFSCAGILLVPFVKVYTDGITDANYIAPVFSVLIVSAFAILCMRNPYIEMIKAAGHYKQTQWSCIVEAALNVVLSIIFVLIWGLPGVAVGTLIAMTFRTIYCVLYLKRDILNRPLRLFIKNVCVDLLIVGLTILATYWFAFNEISWMSWLVLALKVSSICLCITLVINCIFYFKQIRNVVKGFINKIKKGKTPQNSISVADESSAECDDISEKINNADTTAKKGD